MNKYPSLYAALEPASFGSHRGSRVRCTATRRELGFVWWTSSPSNGIAWHFQVGDVTGERNTERNAVQSLRDLSNGQSAYPLLDLVDDVVEQRPTLDAPSAPRAAAAPRVVAAAAPPVVQRVTWGDSATHVSDLTSAIADAFRRHQGSK